MAETQSPGAQKRTDGLTTVLAPDIGIASDPRGLVVPYEQVGPLIDARVGQMKAEVERDFASKLAKLDDLPTKWQLIAGAATTVVAVIGLLFALLAYFGDRQDSAIERSATISSQLGDLSNQMDRIENGSEGTREVRTTPGRNDGP